MKATSLHWRPHVALRRDSRLKHSFISNFSDFHSVWKLSKKSHFSKIKKRNFHQFFKYLNFRAKNQKLQLLQFFSSIFQIFEFSRQKFEKHYNIHSRIQNFFSGFAEVFQLTDFDQWNYSPNITWTLIEAGLKLSGTQEYFPENFPLASRTLKIENNEFESCLESIQDWLPMPNLLLPDWTLSSMPMSWLGTSRCSFRYQKM